MPALLDALWLWMARANGWGRNWARILSTVLFGLATLDLTSVFRTPGIRVTLAPTALGPIVPVLTWLVGLAAVWLLWLVRRAHGRAALPMCATNEPARSADRQGWDGADAPGGPNAEPGAGSAGRGTVTVDARTRPRR